MNTGGLWGLGNLWNSAGSNIGQTIGLFGNIYANQSGLTQQQTQAQLYAANLAAKQQSEKLKTYTLIAFAIVFVIALAVIIKKK